MSDRYDIVDTGGNDLLYSSRIAEYGYWMVANEVLAEIDQLKAENSQYFDRQQGDANLIKHLGDKNKEAHKEYSRQLRTWDEMNNSLRNHLKTARANTTIEMHSLRTITHDPHLDEARLLRHDMLKTFLKDTKGLCDG